jgi:sRNA-binding regulator protein Hfq
LSGAIIGGSLDCQDGKFVGKDKYAISLEGAKIAGSVFFRKNPQPVSAQMQGFHVEGLVRLFRATIGGNLECQNGKFINPQGDSINAEGTDIKGSILLRNGFEADGGVRIFGATIGGDLDCQDGKFVGKDKYAISLEGAKVAGNVLFRKTLQAGNEQIQGFQAEGTVHLLGATIGRNLICDGGKFINPQGDSINAEGTDIKGSVYFRNGFEANGGVRMFGATIGGDLDCQNGKFVGRDRYAVSLEGARVSNNVLFRKTLQSESEQIQGFQAEGEVRLFRANIGRDLDCYGGKFINPQGYTINAQNANIKGIIFLGEGFESEGTVSLVNAKIDDSIMIFGVSNSEKMSLDLRFSRLRILVDHEDSWMQKGKIYLNDCVYDTISHESPRDAQRRLDWLRLQDLKEEFSPQPYEQLAKVLRSLGHENDAIQVLIAKQEDRLRYGKISILGKIWQGLLGLTIAHGYKPHRALLFAIIFVLYGGLLFDAADSLGWISHSKCEVKTSVSTSSLSQLPKEYPKFNAYIYSLDLFLPIVDLRQKNNWQPNSNTGYEILIPLLKVQWRSVVQYYFYLHILLGWLLTTLWVAGVTGLVRRLN